MMGNYQVRFGGRPREKYLLDTTSKQLASGLPNYNILRKYAPDAFTQGISACVLRPQPLRLPDRHQVRSKQHVRRKASV